VAYVQLGECRVKEFLELNSLFVALFGGGLLATLWRVGNWIAKLVKAKKAENELREKTINALDAANKEQDKRLQSVEEYQVMAEARSQKIVKAEKASLHNQIWSKADEYITRGYVTVGELNNFIYLFEAYKNLGGNGTGDTLHAKVLSLSVKDEGILQQREIDQD
jgi:hypothetical protein